MLRSRGIYRSDKSLRQLMKEVIYMTIDQMFELAKMGKTPAEIKEFMELEKSTEQSEKPAETPQKVEKHPEPEKAEDKIPEAAADPAPEDKTAELQKQIDDLQKQLAEAQKNNTNKNLSNDRSASKNNIDEIVRSFMS